MHPTIASLVLTLALDTSTAGPVSAQPSPAAASAAPPQAQDARALALAADRSCLRCHDVVRKYVGPSFAQIAERYRQDGAAPERIAGKIRNGSVGAWGRVIMPRQPQVSPADAATLAAWILAQPRPGP